MNRWLQWLSRYFRIQDSLAVKKFCALTKASMRKEYQDLVAQLPNFSSTDFESSETFSAGNEVTLSAGIVERF